MSRFGTSEEYPKKDSFRTLYAPFCRKLVTRAFQIARQQKIILPREIKPGLENDVADALFNSWYENFQSSLKPEAKFETAFDPDKSIAISVVKFFTQFASAYDEDPDKLKRFRDAIKNFVLQEWWPQTIQKLQGNVTTPGPISKQYTKVWGPDVEAVLLSKHGHKALSDRRKSSYDEIANRLHEQFRDDVELKKLYREYLEDDLSWMKTLDEDQVRETGSWKFQNETVNWSKDRVEMRVKDEIQRLYPELNDTEVWDLIYDYIYWDEVWPDLKKMIEEHTALRKRLFDE